MQTINQLTTAISQNAHKQTSTQTNSMQTLHSDSQTSSQHQTAITKLEIASLFNGWKRLFRSKMKDEDWDTDTVVVWHIALTDLQMTASEFATAKRKSLGLQWPPTAPADFLALGRTEAASEYPTAQSAFNTACQNCGMRGDVKRDWKHEVVYETANRIGWGVLASATEYYFKTFQDIYEQVVSEHRNGADFKVPETHRVEHSHAPVQAGSETDKQITAKLAELRRMAV